MGNVIQGPKYPPHPQAAAGDFYVVNGECLSCGVPHALAPELIAWTDGGMDHCIWKKQPETPAELERAIALLEAQDLGCHRYCSSAPEVLGRVSEYCDYPGRDLGPSGHGLPDTAGAIRFWFADEATFWTRLWKKIRRAV